MTSSAHNSIRVLMLSPDRNFFAEAGAAFGDIRDRHQKYASALRELGGEKSELRVICYADRRAAHERRDLPGGLTLIPTRSVCRLMFGPDLVIRLISTLQDWKPDVVTAQSPWAEGILAWAVARMTGAKFLAQIHFDILSPQLAREMKFRFWRPWIAKFLIRRADGVRVVLNSVADSLSQNWSIPRDRFHVCPVPSAFSLQADASHVSNGQNPTVLFVGRFLPSKNIPLWLDVADRVADEIPEARFRLVGSGPEQEMVENRIARSKHSARFETPGHAGGEDLASYYLSADLMLMTPHHEGLARVMIEAGLAGLPTVSTACAGPREVILDGETGYILPRGDREGLADAVVRLLKNPELRHRMGGNARTHIEANFREKRLIERLISAWVHVTRAEDAQ